MKKFLLKHLLKLKDQHGMVNDEAVDALIEAFQDELWEMMQADDRFSSRSHERKELEFRQYCNDTILSIIY